MPAAEALEVLAEVEARIPAYLEHQTVVTKTFHLYREWLIEQRLLGRMLASSLFPSRRTVPGLEMPLAPGLRLRRTARFVMALIDRRASEVLSARAEAIFVNTNLRGFYVSQRQPVTVKVRIRPPEAPADRQQLQASEELSASSSSFSSGLEGEVRRRRYAEKFVNIPPVLEFELAARHPFLVEPVLWGKRAVGAAADELCISLLPRLLALYEDHGYRLCPPMDLLGEEVIDELSQCLEFLEYDARLTPQVMAAATRVLEADRGVALSFTHGDLAPNNLLIDTTGKVFVLDWERAGVGAIARDLFYLLREAPGRYRDVAEAAMRSQAQAAAETRICSLREQLAVVALMKLASWRHYEEQWRAGYRERRHIVRQLREHCRTLERLALEHPRLFHGSPQLKP